MKKILLLFIFLWFSNAHSQNSYLFFSVENDKLFDTDRYYTNGLFVTYQTKMNQDFLFFKSDKKQNYVIFQLGNETYTPTILNSTNTKNFDRPYAGYLFLKTSIRQVNVKTSHTYEVELGLSGKQSYAGRLQTWWHEFNSIEVPTWTQEIENKFLVNVSSQHIFNVAINKNNALHYIVKPSLGFKSIFIENGLSYYVGKLNPFQSSSRLGVLKANTKEFYAVFGVSYAYVFHNTLIQGSLNYNDENFTSTINNSLFKVHAGLVYKNNNSFWQLKLFRISAETPQSTHHNYANISYGFSF